MGQNDKSVIYVLDDNESVNIILEEVIDQHFKNSSVRTFNNIDNFLNDKNKNEADLFIMDQIYKNDDRCGKDVCLFLEENMPLSVFLFMSGYAYDYESFSETNCIYDYITKPFEVDEIVNKIKILLKVSSNQKQLTLAKKNLEYGIWDLFNHSNIFYVLILNSDMTIKLCNKYLANELGFEDEKYIIGRNWLDFVGSCEKKMIKDIFDSVIKKDESRDEVTSKIVTRSGDHMPVRWFNSVLVNGSVLTFSMGIPLTRIISPQRSIESLRAYWRETIKIDQDMIKSLR